MLISNTTMQSLKFLSVNATNALLALDRDWIKGGLQIGTARFAFAALRIQGSEIGHAYPNCAAVHFSLLENSNSNITFFNTKLMAHSSCSTTNHALDFDTSVLGNGTKLTIVNCTLVALNTALVVSLGAGATLEPWPFSTDNNSTWVGAVKVSAPNTEAEVLSFAGYQRLGDVELTYRAIRELRIEQCTLLGELSCSTSVGPFLLEMADTTAASVTVNAYQNASCSFRFTRLHVPPRSGSTPGTWLIFSGIVDVSVESVSSDLGDVSLSGRSPSTLRNVYFAGSTTGTLAVSSFAVSDTSFVIADSMVFAGLSFDSVLFNCSSLIIRNSKITQGGNEHPRAILCQKSKFASTAISIVNTSLLAPTVIHPYYPKTNHALDLLDCPLDNRSSLIVTSSLLNALNSAVLLSVAAASTSTAALHNCSMHGRIQLRVHSVGANGSCALSLFNDTLYGSSFDLDVAVPFPAPLLVDLIGVTADSKSTFCDKCSLVWRAGCNKGLNESGASLPLALPNSVNVADCLPPRLPPIPHCVTQRVAPWASPPSASLSSRLSLSDSVTLSVSTHAFSTHTISTHATPSVILTGTASLSLPSVSSPVSVSATTLILPVKGTRDGAHFAAALIGSEVTATAILRGGAVSAAVASIAAMPSAATYASRVGSLAEVVDCGFASHIEADAVPDPFEHPFYFALGSSNLRHYAGGAVLTLLLFILLPCVLVGTTHWLLGEAPQDHPTLCRLQRYVCGVLVALCFAYFSPGVVGVSVMLISFGDNVVLVVGVLLSVAVIAAWCALVAGLWRLPLRAQAGGRAVWDFRRRLCVTMWIFAEGAAQLSRMTSRLYYVEEVFTSCALAALVNVPSIRGSCTLVALAVIVLCAAHVAFHAFCRPYKALLDASFSVVAGVLQLLLSFVNFALVQGATGYRG